MCRGSTKTKEWITERNLPTGNCENSGSTKENQDKQLEVLMERGQQNGAEVEIWNEKMLRKRYPHVRRHRRCLWSPNTSVVQPKLVIERLSNELEDKGVEIWKSKSIIRSMKCKTIQTMDGVKIEAWVPF